MKKIFAAILIIAALVLMCAPASANSAQSAVLIEAENNSVLYAKDAEKRLPMASTTKIMTAVIALENASLSAVFTVSNTAACVEGSSMYLSAGEHITLKDLLYGLMLSSGNDAAVAIAEGVAGSEENFVALMNAKAKQLGLLNTSFETASGLDGENHYSSAYDMAVLTAYALKNRVFAEIVSSKSKQVGERFLVNHNKLLFNYEYAVGVKTGYTKTAGRCLVSAAVKNGVTLIAVTLSDHDDWNDHISLYTEFFGKVRRTDFCGVGDCYKVPVVGAETAFITASPEKALYAVSLSEHDYNIVVELPRFVYAPVAEGDVIGRICVYEGRTLVDSVNLKANGFAKEKNYRKTLFEWLFGKNG